MSLVNQSLSGTAAAHIGMLRSFSGVIPDFEKSECIERREEQVQPSADLIPNGTNIECV
jgi:hypothetical protein